MRISDAYPSNYLKASDLQGRTVVVTIDHCDIEDIGDERKPILYFQGKQKGMVLNKTNANNVSVLYGDDTDDWIGRPSSCSRRWWNTRARRSRHFVFARRAVRLAPGSRPLPTPQPLPGRCRRL